VALLAVASAGGLLACSSDDAGEDSSRRSVVELHGSGDLAESTSALLGARPPAEPDELADAVADRIATAVEAPSAAAVGDAGRYLGEAHAAFEQADDDGTVAYAARLAWLLGGRLAPEAGDGERLTWVVADAAERPDDECQAIAAALESGDAAEVVESLDGTGAATVVRQAYDELTGLVPVGNEADLLGSLQTAYTTAAR
jgi:hypothetical protein